MEIIKRDGRRKSYRPEKITQAVRKAFLSVDGAAPESTLKSITRAVEGRIRALQGAVQIIRYINRDENTHLWLFRNILLELRKENPELFTPGRTASYREMLHTGCEQEIAWGHYVIGDEVSGLTKQIITDYVQYLGNLRCSGLEFEPIYGGHDKEPESMKWVGQYSNANAIKTDFFEARSTAYSKSGAFVDDL